MAEDAWVLGLNPFGRDHDADSSGSRKPKQRIIGGVTRECAGNAVVFTGTSGPIVGNTYRTRHCPENSPGSASSDQSARTSLEALSFLVRSGFIDRMGWGVSRNAVSGQVSLKHVGDDNAAWVVVPERIMKLKSASGI